MKIVSTIALSLSLMTLGVAPAFADANSHAIAMSKLAPADEYFGPLKMSILGIGNAAVLRRSGALACLGYGCLARRKVPGQ